MAWKKWIIIGVSAGATIVVLAIGVLAAVIWYDSRPTPWRTDALTASEGETRVSVSRISSTGNVESFTGFRVSYVVTNNTDRDITLASPSIRTRSGAGALDEPPVPITRLTTFLPAQQQVRLHLVIPYPFEKGAREWGDLLSRVGLGKNDGELVILDSGQHLELRLPKPSTNREGGVTAFVENP